MSPAELPAPQRLQVLDAARVFATYGIIWTHVAEGHGQSSGWSALGRFGTSFYIIVAALFVVRNVRTPEPRPFADELKRRSRRLLVPYLLWCAIYGAYYALLAYQRGDPWAGLLHWWGPVAGTAVHLWFLPFVFVWGLLAALFVPSLKRMSRQQLTLVSILLTTALYIYCYRRLHFSVSRPWLWTYHLHRLDRWIEEIPLFVAATLGTAVSLKWRDLPRTRSAVRPTVVAFFGLAGWLGVQILYGLQLPLVVAYSGPEGRLLAHAAALCLFLGIGGMAGSAWVRRLAPLSRYTYVAFLVHLLFIELLLAPVKSMPGYGALWFSLAESLVVLGLSLGFSWLVLHTRALKFLRA